ncbi:Alpha/Beta hydrolase protein [Mycena rebaudengoi]|nr:Alpha/Beta hydrolase protein [Mycena rebaudengoi]
MHLRKSLARIYLATTVLVAVGAQTPGPIIDLGYAQYQGTINPATNITNFMGMRYAAAPIGDLHFRAPQPPANVTGVQQATAQPNQCVQAVIFGTSPTNPVYFPSDAAGNPSATDLPIVVWIHGGGCVSSFFSLSSSSMPAVDVGADISQETATPAAKTSFVKVTEE